MRALLSHPILIGTTNDIIYRKDKDSKRRQRMQSITNRYWRNNNYINDNNRNLNVNIRDDDVNANGNDVSTPIQQRNTPNQNSLTYDAALTVHDPFHGSGKTALITAIARSVLHCQAVHIVNGSTLFLPNLEQMVLIWH